MGDFERAMSVMAELFGKDCAFALATAGENVPSVRMVDMYYENGAFYVVTYANSRKVRELEANERVAMCAQAHRFSGAARNIGHPLRPQNAAIRQSLTRVFAPWYFKHNDEGDENMCYVKIEPRRGFFYQNGTGYDVDFENKEVKSFPFVFDAVLPE